MPPKRRISSGSSMSESAPEESKKARIGEDVQFQTGDVATVKAIEESIKKKTYEDLSDLQNHVMKTLAIFYKQKQVLESFQKQKLVLEASLDKAKNLFEKYDRDIKLKDEEIKSYKTEIESLRAENQETIINLESDVKTANNKAFEEEFRANQLEDDLENVNEEMVGLKEEMTAKDVELTDSKETITNLHAEKEKLIKEKERLSKENQNLSVEIKRLKENLAETSVSRNSKSSHEQEQKILQVRSKCDDLQKDLTKSMTQCESLRSELKEKSKVNMELIVKGEERETALQKCQMDFRKIEAQINEFLRIKGNQEIELRSFKGRYSDLSKKHQDLQKTRTEELTKIYEKLDEAQKSITEKQALIDKLTSESELASQKFDKLEEKIESLKRDNAMQAAENDKSSVERGRSENKIMQLERNEERERIQSLEDDIEKKDSENKEFIEKIKELSKKLQKKKDLIKKIERKSHERKLKLKRCQENGLSVKGKVNVDRNNILKVKCIELVMNNDNLSQQMRAGHLTSRDEEKSTVNQGLSSNGSKSSDWEDKKELDIPDDDIDELLIESDDDLEMIQCDRGKKLKPLDVNLSYDDVSDTIENDNETNEQLNDANADIDFEESDELLNIQQFIENTDVVRGVIKDIISMAVQRSSENLYLPFSSSVVSSIRDKMAEESSNKDELLDLKIPPTSELQRLLGYYQQRSPVYS